MYKDFLRVVFLITFSFACVLFSTKDVYAGTQLNRKAFLLIFNPSDSNTNNQPLSSYMGWKDPESLTTQAISQIALMTHNQIGYSIVDRLVVNGFPEKADGFTYTTSSYLACTSNQNLCHQPDISNYNKILSTYQICEKFNAGQFDELWMFGGPWFGFYESNLAGNNAFFYNSGPTINTTCQKLLPIMGFSYERSVSEMIEDFGHRTESTMSYLYPWNRTLVRNNWEKFSLVSVFSPLQNKAAGCGHVHYTPASIGDYDWGNTSPVSSYCDEFLTYADGIDITKTRNMSCTIFGCESLGFFTWWYQHFPHEEGINADGKSNNWYLYAFNPNNVIASTPPQSIPQTLLSTYFTFGKLLYGRYASPSQLRSGDMIYLKNYDPNKLQILSISLYDYTLKKNQGYTRYWRSSTSMFMRTNYLIPAGRKYAFIFTYKDITTGVILKKYFVINTISSSTITL